MSFVGDLTKFASKVKNQVNKWLALMLTLAFVDVDVDWDKAGLDSLLDSLEFVDIDWDKAGLDSLLDSLDGELACLLRSSTRLHLQPSASA
jgi:hypothetical protein